ncbi:MAG: AAA family ATPase [Candidatus Cybelea sp.]
MPVTIRASIGAGQKADGAKVNAKLCAGPSSGGSGRGCVRYILGYELGAREKDDDATPGQRREAFHTLIQESMAREDFGVNAVWQPSVGDGIRPSSVYAKNVTSLATADMEMDALGAIAHSRRVRDPVLHFVFSVNPDQSKHTADEQIIGAAERALKKIDLGGNASIFSVHRDTEHAHVHVAVASVNAHTLEAWERSRNYSRLSWAVREVEIEMGLPHDRGLAVVREDLEGIKRVEWASRAELVAWARERVEERLKDQARKYARDYLVFEDPRSWATDVVAPRLREYIEEAQGRGEQIRWADMHVIAAQSAVRLEQDRETGAIMVRVLERQKEGEGSRAVREVKLDGFGEPMEPRARMQREMDALPIAIDREDLIGIGPDIHERIEVYRAYEERKTFIGAQFMDAVHAEHDFIAQVKRDPGLVSREIVAGGEAVFSRSDLDRFLGARISEADTLAEVSQYVEQHDGSLRLLSVDTEHPLYTTVAQQTLEERVVAKATALARERDPRFDRAMLDRAIAEVGLERGMIVSDEQRRVLDGLEYRLSWVQGDAGTGKTTIMAVANRYAELSQRPIVGFTTAQAAAEHLQSQSGAFALNSTRALVYEEHAGKRIIERRAIAMLDETSMLDMAAYDKMLNLVREREAIVIGIGDAAQLPAIAAGDTHRLMCDVTNRHGHYVELHDVRRQRDELEWMRPIVRDLGRSIREGDREGVIQNIRTMGAHGVFEFKADRKATLEAAAQAYVHAYTAGEPIVLNCDSRLDARHLNREIRDRLGLIGGTRFKTSQGIAEAVVGDRIVFLNNSKTIGVLNGYTATVTSVGYGRSWKITATLDDGRQVSWNPDRYRKWTYGHAVTTHKAQGQSVAGDLYVMTHQLPDARMAHVGWTRGESSLRVIVSGEAYASVGELAQGLAERTQSKSDAILYRELEHRYGGPDTYWAINVRRAMRAADDPLRQAHQRDQRALERRQSAALQLANAKFQQKIARSTTPEQKAKLKREHRSAAKRIVDAHKPQTFVQWAGQRHRAERIQQQGRQLELVADVRRLQERGREQRRAASSDERISRNLNEALERTSRDRPNVETQLDHGRTQHEL